MGIANAGFRTAVIADTEIHTESLSTATCNPDGARVTVSSISSDELLRTSLTYTWTRTHAHKHTHCMANHMLEHFAWLIMFFKQTHPLIRTQAVCVCVCTCMHLCEYVYAYVYVYALCVYVYAFVSV